MNESTVVFEHIHIISQDPKASAAWYADILGGEIKGEYEVRGAPQISVAFNGISILIRGQRSGEAPRDPDKVQHYADFISHNQWGTDHFGFQIKESLDDFCDRIRGKGATFSVEPYDFVPGVRIAYLEAPDGVSIELVQAKP
jgi:catechol 2,3-dioxygenase-like lactoylglutathione lyase family enzyme